MAKVYAVNYSGLDYDKAEEIGELVFMTKGVLNLNRHTQYAKMIEGYCKDMVEEGDFLMFSGPQLICAIALQVWLKYHPKCTVLTWDMDRKKYHRYEVLQ